MLAADDAAIPATVRDAVLARAARLSPPAREVLDAAAVVAPPVGTWLLAEAAAAAADDVDECVAAGMLGRGRRRRLPARAGPPGRGAALAPGRRASCTGGPWPGCWPSPAAPDPARLAHHAEEAGDADAVLDYAPAAAGHAAAWAPTARRPPSTRGPCASPAGCPAELAELLEALATSAT